MVDQVRSFFLNILEIFKFSFIGLIPPMEPFGIENRFTTAAVFGILAYEILQTFEERFFSTRDLFNDGILIELLEIIGLVLLIG